MKFQVNYLCFQGERDLQKRVDKLLEHVRMGGPDRFTAFCSALCESGQTYVVETYLKPTGHQTDGPPACISRTASVNEMLSNPDAAICVDHECKSRLRKNMRVLLKQVNPSTEFMGELTKLHVFTYAKIQTLKVCMLIIVSCIVTSNCFFIINEFDYHL
jgi:hypothetical protein